jgi:hypothetical protein
LTFTTLHLRVPLFALALLLGDSGFAGTEKKVQPPPAPPQPIPQKVKVVRGTPLEITLRVYGKTNQPISYLIRRASSGKLTVPKNTELEAAVVEYQAPADHSITRDSFEYASKSTQGVSAPSAVEIEIVDLAPELIAPAEVVFGPLLGGATDKKTIELENKGGSVAEGDLTVDPPWRVEVTNHYRIEPGQRRSVVLTFAPDKPGDYSADLLFSSAPDRSTTLRGKASAAIEVRPASLVLEAVAGSLTRAGALEVVNHTDEPQTVRVAAPERLMSDPPLTLNPGQSGPLMIRTKDGDVRPIAAEITLESGSYRTIVPVHAEALPGIAQAESTQLELRVVPPKPEPMAVLMVRNDGGQPAHAELSGDAEFTISPDKLDLPVGGEARVEVRLAAGINSPIQGTIDLKSGGATQRIALSAKAAAQPSAPSVPATTSAVPSRPGKAATRAGSYGSDHWSPYEQDPAKPIDPVQIMRNVAISPTSCTIEWHGDRSAAKAFAAEVRELAIGEKGLVQTWRPYPTFHSERTADNKVRGTFEKLVPGRPYTARIREVNDSGDLGAIILDSSFNTPVPDTETQKARWKTTTILVGVGIVFVVLWRRRRTTAA